MDLSTFLSILGLVLVIPLGILTNILTPKIANWYSRNSVQSKAKRIEFLKQQLEEAKNILKNPSTLIARGIGSILKLLLSFFLSNLCFFYLYVVKTLALTPVLFDGLPFESFIYVIMVLLNYVMVFKTTKEVKFYARIYNLEKYEEKVNNDIKSLENTRAGILH